MYSHARAWGQAGGEAPVSAGNDAAATRPVHRQMHAALRDRGLLAPVGCADVGADVVAEAAHISRERRGHLTWPEPQRCGWATPWPATPPSRPYTRCTAGPAPRRGHQCRTPAPAPPALPPAARPPPPPSWRPAACVVSISSVNTPEATTFAPYTKQYARYGCYVHVHVARGTCTACPLPRLPGPDPPPAPEAGARSLAQGRQHPLLDRRHTPHVRQSQELGGVGLRAAPRTHTPSSSGGKGLQDVRQGVLQA